jgi:DNA-binding response OmpR family regulator/predicted regulator of Ras-like GTPase activity (Roadblock/LC7/MglB family)
MSDVWRLFVVVGDESLNQSLVNTLRKDGYVVQGVMSGADAVRVLWAEEYDVVISDCKIPGPGTDGFELLQWLRVYRPNARMIMLGDANANEQRMQALESGADSYLERPIDIRQLKEELRRLLVQTGFSASLDSFDLLDVIQIITMSRKSMTLLINTGLEERGTLCFQNGELVWAEYGILRGEEAFFALAAHKNGTVTQQPWTGQVMPNVTQPLSRLILQALQYRSKYANRQQYSGEIDRVSTIPPGNVNNIASTSSSSFASAFSANDEIDDSPFLFVEGSQGSVSMQPQPYQPPVPASPEENADAGYALPLPPSEPEPQPVQPVQPVKEWWESTGHFARVNAAQENVEDTSAAPTMALDSKALNALLRQIDEAAQPQESLVDVEESPSLPSWLTDQPTSGFTAQGAAAANTERTVLPEMPYIPATPPSPDWTQATDYQTPLSSEQLPPESLETMSRDSWSQTASTLSGSTIPGPAIPGRTVSGPLRPSTRKWESGPYPAANRQVSAALPSVKLPATPLQSTQPQPRQPAKPAERSAQERAPAETATDSIALSSGVLRAQNAARRNYASLVAALQSLGYSISGFIAAAVMTLEGQPIAQVAVNDTDVSKLCKYFSTIQKSVLQGFEQERWGEYEDIVITSGQCHILMRVVGSEKKTFQVLMTTREANPQDSLSIMASVDSAISAALS